MGVFVKILNMHIISIPKDVLCVFKVNVSRTDNTKSMSKHFVFSNPDNDFNCDVNNA